MSITLSDGTVTLALADDLRWTDEASWTAVEQSVERSVTGALIVSLADRGSVGRPITLAPPDEASAWMPRATLDQLLIWAALPGQQLTLVRNGVTRTVILRHHDAPAIDATPVVYYSDEQSDDPYLITLKLMQV